MKTLFYYAAIILAVFAITNETFAQNANKTLSNLTSPTSINVDLLPDKSNTHNLGSTSKSWKNIFAQGAYFLKGTKFINAAGTQNTLIGSDAGKSITSGYDNVANGYQALYSNTTGGINTAAGFLSLYENTTGFYNSAYGAYSLYFNTSGYHNTAMGHQALYENNTGNNNTAVGNSALGFNTSGNDNTAIGNFALESNTTGFSNVAIGTHALYKNSTVANLVAVGDSALYNNTIGTFNTALGSKTLTRNTSGVANTAVGFNASYYNTTGVWNTAVGLNALADNTTGSYSTAVGVNALVISNGSENDAFGGNALAANTSGIQNTAMGNGSLYRNNIGNYNTAFGYATLYNNTSSQYNTALGYAAGYTFDNGYNNVFVGAQTDVNQGGLYNVVALGHQTICTASSQARIGNSFTTSIGGQVGWTTLSDGRVKKNIKPNVPGLAFINKLQPITYNLNLDAVDNITQPPAAKDKDGKPFQPSQQELDARKAKEQTLYTGFIAQDVEKAAKSLNYNFSGVDAAKNSKDLYGLRYSDFVVPLVKAVQELSKQNDSLKNELAELKTLVLSRNTSIISNTQSTTISSASLEQNVPNPFNNTTTIHYTLPQQYSSAKIIITDKSGNVLKEMNISGAGKGSVQVDASTLSSGTYQYSLVVNGKPIGTKQMMLVK